MFVIRHIAISKTYRLACLLLNFLGSFRFYLVSSLDYQFHPSILSPVFRRIIRHQWLGVGMPFHYHPTGIYAGILQ